MIGCGVQSSQRWTNINTSSIFVRVYANFPKPRKEATVGLVFVTAILEIVSLVWAVIGSPKHCEHVSSVSGDDADINMDPSQLSKAMYSSVWEYFPFLFVFSSWDDSKLNSHLRLMDSTNGGLLYKYWTTAQLWVRTDSHDAEFNVTHRVSV